VISNPGIRPLGTLFGSGLLLTGVILMGISQSAAGNRQASGTPWPWNWLRLITALRMFKVVFSCAMARRGGGARCGWP
jgi:hypothetical protein